MSTELMTIEITKELGEYEGKVRSELEALAEQARHLTIKGCAEGQAKGFAIVKEVRLKLKAARCGVTNWRKDFTKPLSDAIKASTAKEKSLIDIISQEETRLQAEEDTYEAEQMRIQREKEEVIKARQFSRIVVLQELGTLSPQMIDYAKTAPEEAWDDYVQHVKADNEIKAKEAAEKEAEFQRLKAIDDARIAKEKAEEEKRIADAKEAERLERVAFADAKRKLQQEQKELEEARALLVKPALDVIENKLSEIKEQAKREIGTPCIDPIPENTSCLDVEISGTGYQTLPKPECVTSQDLPLTDGDLVRLWRKNISNAIREFPCPDFADKETFEAIIILLKQDLIEKVG